MKSSQLFVGVLIAVLLMAFDGFAQQKPAPDDVSLEPARSSSEVGALTATEKNLAKKLFVLAMGAFAGQAPAELTVNSIEETARLQGDTPDEIVNTVSTWIQGQEQRVRIRADINGVDRPVIVVFPIEPEVLLGRDGVIPWSGVHVSICDEVRCISVHLQ